MWLKGSLKRKKSLFQFSVLVSHVERTTGVIRAIAEYLADFCSSVACWGKVKDKPPEPKRNEI